MSNLEIPTYRLRWEVAKNNEADHRDCPDDTMQEMVNQDWDKNPSVPTPDYGITSSWSSYNRLSTASIVDDGPYAKSYSDGYINGCNWGSTSKKHSEIFSLGLTKGDGQQVWVPSCEPGGAKGITGYGFRVRRERTDSKSYTNDNCKNWCAFIRRFGVRFINRNDGSYRFWSSTEQASDGLPLARFGNPSTTSATWSLDEFYNTASFGTNSKPWTDGQDWLIESLWWNITNRNISATGSATTKIYIYDLKFYSYFGIESVSVDPGSQRVIRPGVQTRDDRNVLRFG